MYQEKQPLCLCLLDHGIKLLSFMLLLPIAVYSIVCVHEFSTIQLNHNIYLLYHICLTIQ